MKLLNFADLCLLCSSFFFFLYDEPFLRALIRFDIRLTQYSELNGSNAYTEIRTLVSRIENTSDGLQQSVMDDL
jgi:hypothetical protein